MNQKNICRRNLINATIVCLVGPFLAGSPLNRLLSWILEITVQVQIPECFMFGLMLAIYFATVVPIALLFLLFAYMSMSLNDLPSKTRRIISALFHFAPIAYFIMLPCMMIVGVIKDQAPIQILYMGYLPLGNPNHFLYQGERLFNGESIDHAMMILIFGTVPLLISYMITSRFDSKSLSAIKDIDMTS